jgi:hypothetical protein
VPEGWDRRIRRAEELGAANSSSVALLSFYTRLLRRQQAISQIFEKPLPAGSLASDLGRLVRAGVELVRDVAAHGPEQLAAEGRTILANDAAGLEQQLLAYWRCPSDRQFFAKAILQPYAERLANEQISIVGRTFVAADDNRCPFCGGAPQVSVLETSSESNGGGRRLLCATCLSMWSFRRVRCPGCGEEHERKLGYFHAPPFEHVRVDVCESCRRYLKTIDLGRLGLAIPIVDEVAAAPLDLWARERGYEKIELNLVGL